MNFYLSGWGFLMLAAVNNCIGSLLLKKSRLVATDPGLLALLFSPWFIGGIMVYGINVILFARALDKLPVSTAYPIFAGIGFSLIAIAGNVLFGERFELNQWVGLATIFAGIIIMSR
ncbi:SMR family transporter [Lyngbya sp. CCY1209]|uniref:DMT family transporter n=1 Tax=Lyngbya sp. CCY1209 TaxID=2886103 RepID=UPI002D209363|nr:SMR family transporter [Lyngbya sp. CCY1209]MEB3882978.1 small multidrug resistance protein [Lyngbya sp. CCY1209]